MQQRKAVRVDDIDTVKNTPGAFEYFVSKDDLNTPKGLIYCCPCGCGILGVLDFRPHESPSWEWDGNREKPTLHPSVNHVGHWHGWLRNGIWETC